MKKTWLIPAVVAAAIALAAGAFLLGRSDLSLGPDESVTAAAKSSAAAQSRLKDAWDACNEPDVFWALELVDDGQSLVITTGEYGAGTGPMACVLTRLKTSQSIRAQMDRTTALMGLQKAEDDGLAYSWSFHPKNGVNMIIEYVDN